MPNDESVDPVADALEAISDASNALASARLYLESGIDEPERVASFLADAQRFAKRAADRLG